MIDEFLTVSLYQPNEFISRKKDEVMMSTIALLRCREMQFGLPPLAEVVQFVQ